MKQNWISRIDAAKILGVTPQTVSNYAAEGLLHQKRRGNFSYFPYTEVMNLSSVPAVYSYGELKEKVEQMKAGKEKEYESLRAAYQIRKEELQALSHGVSNWYRYKDMIRTIVDIVADKSLVDRERNIIRDVIDCVPISEIAENYNLTYERIRTIYQKALRKILLFPHKVETEKRDLEEQIVKLKAEKDALKNKLARMMDHSIPETTQDEYYLYRCTAPFNFKLSQMGLSVRALNVCKAGDIETIGDLVSYNRNEMMKFRNFGRKTMTELDLLLEKMSLSFGMWRDPKRRYY